MAHAIGPTKLSVPAIYDKMRPLMCSISTPLGETSGFLLRDGVVLTVAHSVLFNEPDAVQLNHSSFVNPFFPRPIQSINPDNAKALDLFAFQTGIGNDNVLPILPEAVKLHEGMKVYFAGFPLGHEQITFHKGVISSISSDQGIEEFTIDGTVVPGNSGGPVVVLYEGVPHLIGVITSELADFSSEDLKTIAIMEQLNLQYQSARAHAPAMGTGSIRLDGSGVSTTVEIETPEGKENYTLSDRDAIGRAFKLIQGNLSTGIGKAVDIRGYKYLTHTTSLPTATSSYFFPTKGKGVITGSVVSKQDNKPVLKYTEVRFGSGKGHRGIRLVMSNGSGAYTYKFSPNPHTAPGNYNKNQKELYDNAGVAFAQKYLPNNIPLSFSFEACKHDYIATKE